MPLLPLLLLILPLRLPAVVAGTGLALALAAALAAAGRPPLASRVAVGLDLGGPSQPFPHYWTRSFGSGHALMGTRADWQAHLRLAVDELGLQGYAQKNYLKDLI